MIIPSMKDFPHEKTYALLREKFNIVAEVLIMDVDRDFDKLYQFLVHRRKECFDPQDRILVSHFDTDYYDECFPVGVYLRNVFTAWQRADLPMFTMLLFTNHLGISREVDLLCQSRHSDDRPTVIETIVSQQHVRVGIVEPELDVDSISHHALTMLGTNRSHRHALINHLAHISPDKLVLANSVEYQ